MAGGGELEEKSVGICGFLHFLCKLFAYMKKLLYLRTPPCQYNNHPRRMPLLPKAEGRSAPESTFALTCQRQSF